MEADARFDAPPPGATRLLPHPRGTELQSNQAFPKGGMTWPIPVYEKPSRLPIVTS